MAKLFIAVIPKSECDDVAKKLIEVSQIFDFKTNCLLEPHGYDANYYEICYEEQEDMARTGLEFVTRGPNGMMHLLGDICRSVYGLYEATILSDNITLEQFIEKDGG